MENKPQPSPRNSNNTIIAIEICEPVAAIEIYPVHSLYTIASDYIDVDDIENNRVMQEPIIYEPPKQDCCPLQHESLNCHMKLCIFCSVSVICFGFGISFWS